MDATGRVANFYLIPMADLQRLRIDIVGKLSGIFRDSFEYVAHRLDDMFSRASALGGREGRQQNLIVKVAAAIASDAPDEIGHSRWFLNPAGFNGQRSSPEFQLE
jgi:magnesium chelatase subunit H